MKHTNKQVLYLYSASLFSTIIGVLVSVLNTNNLSPEEYGDVRYINNIMQFLSGFLSFGYFVSGSRLLAISSNRKITASIKGVLIIILVASIIIMTLLMLILGGVHFYLQNPASSLFFIAIPICSAPLLLNYINTVFQGDNQIGGIALGRLLPSLFYLCVAYYIYETCGATSTRMLLLQNGMSVFVLAIIILWSKPSFNRLRGSFNRLQVENKRYGLQVYIGSICGVSLNYLAGVTLGLFNSSNESVGLFTLALTISAPLAMLPTIIGTTYFKQFAQSNFIQKKIILGTVGISVVSLMVYIAIIPFIISYLYPESYVSVASYASVLAIGTTVHGLGDMFNRFLGAHGQGKFIQRGAIVTGLVLLIGNVVLVWSFGIAGAIMTKILASTCYCYIMIYFYRKLTIHRGNKNERQNNMAGL